MSAILIRKYYDNLIKLSIIILRNTKLLGSTFNKDVQDLFDIKVYNTLDFC